MNDIVLNGVSINDLREKRGLIQKEANQFVADGIDRITEIVRELEAIYEEDDDCDFSKQHTELIDEARKLAENVSLVSDISGVAYYLPWCGESCVLAIERSLVPFGTLSPRQAFEMALEKVCTSITSGWFREWSWEHYYDALENYPEDYYEKFKSALARDEIEPFSGITYE